MKVWEAINILESLDPKSEVTLVIGKAKKAPEFDKTYVIGKEQWVNPPAYPVWYNTITCGNAH